MDRQHNGRKKKYKRTNNDLILIFQFLNNENNYEGASWAWSYGSWIGNNLCSQCLSPLKLWVFIPLMAKCTRYNIMWQVCQWLTACRWYKFVSDLRHVGGTSLSVTYGMSVVQVCQWLTACRWFPPGSLVSTTNKTDHRDITEILLKVALNTITLIAQFP
jgi:hypothetical protein